MTVADNGWVLQLNPQSVPVADYLDLSAVPLDTALMTQTVLYTRNGAPVFTMTDGSWTHTEGANVGDILLFGDEVAAKEPETLLRQREDAVCINRVHPVLAPHGLSHWELEGV